LAEAGECIYAADGVEDVVAARHFDGIEIARALWDGWFLCHVLLLCCFFRFWGAKLFAIFIEI
jgi:hypothetical protein